jgi:hypothetical protein
MAGVHTSAKTIKPAATRDISILLDQTGTVRVSWGTSGAPVMPEAADRLERPLSHRYGN